MPHIGTGLFSRRRRETIDGPPCQCPESPQIAPETKSWRNKLRKRPPFRYSELNIATTDLTALMGNNFSMFDKVSRPSRPPRPCATDLPDLPSLPMYEAFCSKHHPAIALEDENKPPIPPKSSSRRSSISEWPLIDTNPPRGRPSERRDSRQSSISRGCHSSSVDAHAATSRPPAPRYDRASHLAESYRALLPDMDSVETTGACFVYQPEPPRSQSCHKWSWEAQHRLYQNEHPHPGAQLGHSLPEKAPELRRYEFQRESTIMRSGPIFGARPASDASSSTVTAVDHGSQSADEDMAIPWSLHLRSRGTWLSREPHPQQLQRNRRPCSSDDVGLQICTELLSDELGKAFFGGRHGGSHGPGPGPGKGAGISKLQILLLIEAYEATQETCRREVLRPPLTGAAEAEGRRKSHAREAVRILDHWLDVLYSIYDENFAGDDARLHGGELCPT